MPQCVLATCMSATGLHTLIVGVAAAMLCSCEVSHSVSCCRCQSSGIAVHLQILFADVGWRQCCHDTEAAAQPYLLWQCCCSCHSNVIVTWQQQACVTLVMNLQQQGSQRFSSIISSDLSAHGVWPVTTVISRDCRQLYTPSQQCRCTNV
jgi:hypothetical protein